MIIEKGRTVGNRQRTGLSWHLTPVRCEHGDMMRSRTIDAAQVETGKTNRRMDGKPIFNDWCIESLQGAPCSIDQN